MRNLITIILLIIICPLFSFSQVYNQIQKVIASDRTSGDVFGFTVSLSGSYAVIGAQYQDSDTSGLNTLSAAGAAYIFELDNNGHWVQKQKIVQSDRTSNDYFGASVSISGNMAVLGAYDKNAIGGNTFTHAGAAYIFKRNNNGVWNEIKKLVASDTGANDHFGYSVAISGNYIIIGSPIDAEDAAGGNTLNSAGSAYIFEQDGNGNWNQTQKIVPSDRASADLFGTSVSISGNYAIAGAYQEDENPAGGNTLSNAGSAYIFERDGNGVWNQKQKIVPSDRAISDRFGISVSVCGTYAVAGAYLEDLDETGGYFKSAAGAAYIFERDGNGNWIQAKKITAPDRDPNDYFGQTVYIDGNIVIAGAVNEAADAHGGNISASAGAAYIFKRNGNGNWNQTQKIAASDRANNDNFGISVAVNNNYAFAGAYLEDEDLYGGNSLNGAGSSYIFEACHSSSSTLNKAVCRSYSSPSGNHTWTSTGTYMDTIPNTSGCDSIITIHLTLISSVSTLNKAVCGSYTSPSGNYTWSHSNTYMDTIPNSQNCDSVITINLIINNSSSALSETACSSYTSPSGNYTWTNSNTYLDTIPNAKGCDRLITINLTINSSSSNIYRTACYSYISPSGNYVWTSSGIYIDTIPNAKSCDSMITIHLTINTLSSNSELNRTACVSYISPSGNYTWAAPGTYMDTIPNTAGCDSIITIHLTINTISTSSVLNQTVCSSYTSPSGRYTWTSSNTYSDTIPNSEGCDSLITINLIVKNTLSILNETACYSYTSPSGNYTWANSGIYKDTIPNTAGCDSIITINLAINHSSSIINKTACYNYTSPSGHYTWTSSGTYLDTISNASGCDSIMTIHLIFFNSGSNIYQTVCGTYTSPSGNYTWTNSGTYIDTIPNTAGCDSLITIHLIVNAVSTGPTISQTVCGSYTSPSGNYTWTSSNTYTDTIPNAVGCDSIITINLIVNTVSAGPALYHTACRSYISPSGNYTWTSSNTYTDTIPNIAGCDSIITINLTINNVYIVVNQNGTTLMANSPVDAYQWIDCDNGNSIITGEVSHNFTASANGSYAIIITENGCTDTSVCYEITSAGLSENTVENIITISPNPANTAVNISFELLNNGNIVVELFSAAGQIVYSQKVKNAAIGKYSLKIETADLDNGLYFIAIQNGSGKTYNKLIIDK